MSSFRHSHLILLLAAAALISVGGQFWTRAGGAEPEQAPPSTVTIKGSGDGPAASAPQPRPAPRQPAVRPARDPFANTKAMQDEAARQAPAGEARFTPGTDNRNIPELKLKGYIEDRFQSPIALIEIQGYGVFLVREGDAISLQTRSGNALLKVQRVTNISVQVEIGSLGQVMVVR
jgi:hypothetical protein